MQYIVGSARIDENGHATGGKPGDQKQKSTPDFKGEVSMQPFYVDYRGYYVLRPKKDSHAVAIAKSMKNYCNDVNVGYNQNQRNAIMTYDGKEKTNCDCATLIERCVKDATGVDPKGKADVFYTANERALLLATGLFNDMGKYKAGMKLFEGDILVTCTKGHTLAVVEGESRAPKPAPATKTVVTYASHLTGGSWLSAVSGYNNTDDNGYSGVYGKPIDLVMAKVSKGTITYRVHSCKGKKWYGAVTGYDKADANNGHAGVKGNDIDGIAIKVSGVSGKLKYRVHTIKGKWLPWVSGYDTKDNNNGYAGNFGEKIDGIQIAIE